MTFCGRRHSSYRWLMNCTQARLSYQRLTTDPVLQFRLSPLRSSATPRFVLCRVVRTGCVIGLAVRTDVAI